MKLLIYGAYGYTGRLIAELAVQQGLDPILAGRDHSKTHQLAEELGAEARVFPLTDLTDIRECLKGVHVMVHCAGPFSRTSKPMADACLKNGSHYIDITGEIDVFEALANREMEARQAGVMLLPGAGFDVVPSDCLSLYLKDKLPTANHLTLATLSTTKPSRGTARSSIERIDSPGMIRREGRLIKIPAASLRREIDFGNRKETAVAIAWGDLSTAWRSTAIPNIETYMALSPFAVTALRLSRKFGRLLRTKPAQGLMKRAINLMPAGPDNNLRRNGSALIYGEVHDPSGKNTAARLSTPEPYALTALTALACARKVLDGAFTPGFQTPAQAFGKDMILDIDGCIRIDL